MFDGRDPHRTDELLRSSKKYKNKSKVFDFEALLPIV